MPQVLLTEKLGTSRIIRHRPVRKTNDDSMLRNHLINSRRHG